MNATATLPLQTIDSNQLADVLGGFDWGRMVDNGNRYGTAGAFLGGGAGLAIGSPGGPPGMGLGAGIGAAVGGVGGWLGGAGYDAYQQLRGN